jgi:Holliday junction DNA helicase RuvA
MTFARIDGTLRERGENTVLIEVAGLSYSIMLPGCVADKVASIAIGEPLRLEIFSYLQIDGNRGAVNYVGFTNTVERDFFEALLTVASIGPKTAARACSRPMAENATTIDEGDHATLRRLPGIGAQKAKDIIAKLQGKVSRFGLIQGERDGKRPALHPDFAAEAIEVLLQLQYRRAEVERIAAEAMAANKDIANAEDLLAEIYRQQRPATT